MICVVSSLKQQLVTWNAWGSVFTHSCDRSSQSYVFNELDHHFACAVVAAAHKKTITFLDASMPFTNEAWPFSFRFIRPN